MITSPYSFVASANCILYERARPVFVDVDPVTLTIEPNALEAAARKLVARGERPKAILPVHVFGHPADMDPIRDIAMRYGLAIIEDACEAIGATYKGRAVGTLGSAAVFAFYPNKQITTGEGGMIVTADPVWTPPPLAAQPRASTCSTDGCSTGASAGTTGWTSRAPPSASCRWSGSTRFSRGAPPWPMRTRDASRGWST